jgi:hypothetical protein
VTGGKTVGWRPEWRISEALPQIRQKRKPNRPPSSLSVSR